MLMSLNLRWKIMLALVGLSIVPLLLVQVLASRLVDDIATDDLGQLALRTTSYLQRSITRNQQELLDKGILAARSADLANAVHFAGLTGETRQLEALLESLQQHGHLDLAEVHDDNGRVLVRKLASGQSLPPTDNSALSVLKKALAGKAASSINNYDDHVALIAAIPVQLQEQHLGQLVLVNFIDNEFAVESAHISDAEVAFFNATGVFASSHRDLDGVDLWRVMDQKLSEVPLANKPYSLFYSEMGQTGLSMLVALDRSGAKAAILSMRNLLWSAVAGAGLIAILLGMFFSRGIVHPLNSVVASLQEIAEGEADLTRELPVTSRDEVGLLASSFNRFVSRLRDMVNRTSNVAIDLVNAGEKIQLSSRQVNEEARTQSGSLEESHLALIAIDTSSNEVAESIGSLVSAVEESSSATLELGATIEQISAQMEKLFSTVDEVSSSISEMSVSSQQVAENVDILNSSTEVTASSIIELDASIKEIEENAEQTGKLAEAAAHDAESGKQAVEATISGIGAIQQTVDSAGVTIRELGSQSNAIGKILTVIDDVADQTSLLALNAAIIAAQAGDHGRGFAVVADEIRELADRTAVSTREIGQIIDRVQSGTQDAVQAMETGAERVHQEMARSKEAGRALEQIRSSTLKANEQVRSIVRATQEQSRGSRQITDSINQVSSMLSQIAGAVRQQNEGTRQLARAAEAMKEIASHGKLGTAEHAKGSRQINISMEQIRQMTERIDGATQAQAERSREVVKTIASLKQIAENNAVRTAELDAVVDDLTNQTAALEDEVGAFKV